MYVLRVSGYYKVPTKAQTPDEVLTLWSIQKVLTKVGAPEDEVGIHQTHITGLKFSVTKVWASCIMEEFFAQGDEEKKLGIPVGMINDRDSGKISTFY